jgi:hypothetical protein
LGPDVHGPSRGCSPFLIALLRGGVQ